MTLLDFAMSIMLALSPGRDHTVLATATANVIEHRGCLYKGEGCEQKTAAVMATWAWFESSLRVNAKGKTNDCGAWQHVTQDPLECARLRSDANYAADVAWDDMHASLKACGDLSVFARGTCSAGRAIVARRTPKVLWAMRKVVGK